MIARMHYVQAEALFISSSERLMKEFTKKYENDIAGTLSCFDRIVFKGHLPISGAGCMASFLRAKGILLKDFARYVQGPAKRLKQYATTLAQQEGRPYIYLKSRRRKEELARNIVQEDGIHEGLVCVMAATESCFSFRIQGHKQGPRLENAMRKCLCLYFYWMEPELGLIHVRVQTWFPFTIQICLNGHQWLARQMCRQGIGYHHRDNCFLSIEDFTRAQELADDFVRLSWVAILNGLAARCNPLLQDLLNPMQYYWVCDQVEYSTDVVFADPNRLKPLYEKLLEHAIVRLGAKDILTFLDKVADGRFKSEQFNVCRRRQMGSRVRHWVKRNWIKMYNKAGVVLRVETVINHPYDFKVFRSGIRKGEKIEGWFPLSKGVAYLYRHAQIAATANGRYLNALALQEDPGPAQKQLRELVQPVERGAQRFSGFNPAREFDRHLFSEIMRAEYLVSGFQNASLRAALFGDASNPSEKRRLTARVTRLLQKLHARKLIAKIPRSRKWRITSKGLRLLGALQGFFEQTFYQHYAAGA